MTAEEYREARSNMVTFQIESRGVRDARVLQAIRDVPRHLFVPHEAMELAYEDRPLPIGHGQTISQPYIVAYMTESARLAPTDRVLEVGTGSGYQTAVLARLVKEVYTIEIVEPLAKAADAIFAKLGLRNIHAHVSDGHAGWPDAAPFDAILVTAAPSRVPEALVSQLKTGGRMIIPVGTFSQDLLRVVKTEKGASLETLIPVGFVPMTGGGGGP